MAKIAFIFPGQGSQYVGMGKDFYETFPVAKQTFEEADDILHRNISKIIFNGPGNLLTETQNSQVAIFIVSLAILRVLQHELPHLEPTVCAGLSLGEYTALVASSRLNLIEGLKLVQNRGKFMNDACEKIPGTMAVVLGLEAAEVENLVKEAELPHDLWVANFNCPGRVVIAGTLRGVEKGSELARQSGAKRVLPLQVHGAFHSGLMEEAKKRLEPYITNISFTDSPVEMVMNVPGDYVQGNEQIKNNLILQVTHSVRWEQGVRRMVAKGVDQFYEVGCGKALSGFMKRIAPGVQASSIEQLADLKNLVGIA